MTTCPSPQSYWSGTARKRGSPISAGSSGMPIKNASTSRKAFRSTKAVGWMMWKSRPTGNGWRPPRPKERCGSMTPRRGRCRSPLPTPSDSVHGYAWSPDSQQLAAACADGFLRVWSVDSGQQLLEVLAHEGGANDAAFSRDGRHLYSCGYDDLAKSWNARTGEQELEFSGHA